MSQILDPKNGFQVKFETQKYGTHTPVHKYDKYPLGCDDVQVAEIDNLNTNNEKQKMKWTKLMQ